MDPKKTHLQEVRILGLPCQSPRGPYIGRYLWEEKNIPFQFLSIGRTHNSYKYTYIFPNTFDSTLEHIILYSTVIVY